MSAALSLSGITVRYGSRVAVDDLSLEVAAGDIVGLLGPNGAGKSTTLLAAAGGLSPASGTIHIAGADLAREPRLARQKIGLADQPPSLYDYFTAAEHVTFVAEVRCGGSEADARAVLAELGLADIADRLCRELSFGMRQRVGLAAALVGEPAVLLLDETLNGLDPRAARRARDTLEAAAKGGAAVLLSTHMLGVAERLCDRIVIMDGGQVRADVSGDALAELVRGGPGALEALYFENVRETSAEETRA
ncbi:MAG TPA: ABC transporter ATP-binding protein [Kofleriaceae bacterium]|nr:ABC transporter ATP-binding protein [Kofleriaceae bacterium]